MCRLVWRNLFCHVYNNNNILSPLCLFLETRVDDNKSTFITENSDNDHNIHVTGLFEFPITTQTECVPFGAQKHLINLDDEQLVIEFKTKDGEY